MAEARDPKDVRRIEELERENAELKRRISELERLVEELLKRQRKEKRQAHPFARKQGKQEKDKKRPGRPIGHEAAWRVEPERVDESVEARLDGCPQCGSAVQNIEELIQYVVDLPEVRAHVLRILTERAWCPCCRRRVRSAHPRQVSRAGGAASVAVGPRAMALATELKTQQGVPYRDVASLFGRYFGFEVSHGALVQASVRLADKATPDYLNLIEVVRSSSLVHTDDTGWRIARLAAWLWVFATDEVTVYVIDYRRGADVVIELLGEDFSGTLMSDGLPALNSLDEKGFDRIQCNGHIIRRARDMEATQTRGAVRFPREVKGLLQDAIELGHNRHNIEPGLYGSGVAEIRQALTALVSQNFSHEDNLRLAKHIFRHQEALLRFLDDPSLPATNNLAEQQLRGAVVTRKIGGCNRSAAHAHSHAVLSSLAQTAHRAGETLIPHVVRWMCPNIDPSG